MKKNMQYCRINQKAFTLIELLVAIGITAMLTGIMVQMISSVASGWARTNGALITNSQARQVLDQLTNDIQTAIMRRDGKTWLIAVIQDKDSGAGKRTGAFLVTPKIAWSNAKPDDVRVQDVDTRVAMDDPMNPDNSYRFGRAGVWLRLFSFGVSSSGDGVLPTAVSYQILRASYGQEKPYYQLYRSFLKSEDVFQIGFDMDQSRYGNPSDELRSPIESDFLANNVIDFGVRFWAYNSTKKAKEIIFPTDGNKNESYAVNSDESNKFPEEIEVMVRILSDEGARQISLFEEDPEKFPGRNWWSIALAHSTVFSKRIKINASVF